MLEEVEFDIAIPKFRDTCMYYLDCRGKITGKMHQVLKLWKEYTNNGTFNDEISAEKKVLAEVPRSRLHIRRSGITYDQLRRDSSNGRDSRIRKQPHDAIEAAD